MDVGGSHMYKEEYLMNYSCRQARSMLSKVRGCKWWFDNIPFFDEHLVPPCQLCQVLILASFSLYISPSFSLSLSLSPSLSPSFSLSLSLSLSYSLSYSFNIPFFDEHLMPPCQLCQVLILASFSLYISPSFSLSLGEEGCENSRMIITGYF